ncbi:MAG: hypothetical protein NTX25_14955 [Proteobacteria bacterium]|nr:hypothetical protein [Pseudomonadota bacterium]
MSNSWIQIGIVGKAHGLRGAFFVAQRDEDLPAGLRRLRVGPDPEAALLLTLTESRRAADRLVLQCLELKSREEAEAIKMQPIWCQRSELKLEDKSEYLWADLVGKPLIDSEAKPFGVIRAVGNFGASDVVRVEAADGRWTEIPFVKFYFDMSFASDSECIKMLVPTETFDDTWNLK